MEDNTGNGHFDFSRIPYCDVKDLVGGRIEVAKYTGNVSVLAGMKEIIGLPDDKKREIRFLLTADFMIRNIGQLGRFFSCEAREDRQEILDAMKILGASMGEEKFLAAKKLLVEQGNAEGLSTLYYIAEKMNWKSEQAKPSAEDAMIELAYSCIKTGGKNQVETVSTLLSNGHMDDKTKERIRDGVIANPEFYHKLLSTVRTDGGVRTDFPRHLFTAKNGKQLQPVKPDNQTNGRKNEI